MNEQDWRQVVAAATRAPSIYNTQPWLFIGHPDRIDVFTDPERALPVLDRTGRQRVISCGAAVEFAAVALRALGHDAEVTLLPDETDTDHLATIQVQQVRDVSSEDRMLVEAIEQRHTQRAAFLPRRVPRELVDRLQAEAGSFDVWVKAITESEEGIAAVFLIARAEEIEQGDPDYLAELRSWLRTDPAAVDGVPVDSVPSEDPATRPSNWLVRDFIVGERPAPHSRVHPLDPDAPPPPVERPTVLLLGTDGDDRHAWLQAGRALGRLLLRATAAGLAASSLTQALDWPSTREQMRMRLSLIGHPQMLLRLGYPSTIGTSTGRRPVEEVLR